MDVNGPSGEGEGIDVLVRHNLERVGVVGRLRGLGQSITNSRHVGGKTSILDNLDLLFNLLGGLAPQLDILFRAEQVPSRLDLAGRESDRDERKKAGDQLPIP